MLDWLLAFASSGYGFDRGDVFVLVGFDVVT
jgi:hypothetical protein